MTFKHLALSLSLAAILPALAVSAQAQSDGQSCRAEHRTIDGKAAVCTVCTKTVCDEASALRSPACHKETNTNCELSGSATTTASRSGGPKLVVNDDADAAAEADAKSAKASAAAQKAAAAKMAAAKMGAARQKAAAAARAAAMAEAMEDMDEDDMPAAMMRSMPKPARGMTRKMMEMMEEMDD